MKDDQGLSTREKAFADLVITGMPMCRAYLEAGYKANDKTAKGQAYRVMRRPQVVAYVRAERQALAELSRMEKWELVQFLCTAITTPVGAVDEESPLAQEFTVDEIGKEKVRTRVKMIGKLDSAKLLASMLGWTTPEKNNNAAGAKMAEVVLLVRNKSC